MPSMKKTIEIFDRGEKVEGMKLLENTFNSDDNGILHPNVIALARIYQAIAEGEMKINGQNPNQDIPIGRYLMHGGRIQFDLSELSKQEQNQFYEYIFKVQGADVFQRKYATHALKTIPKNKRNIDEDITLPPAIEIKTTLFSAWKNLATPQPLSKHLGMNIPVGGEGKKYTRKVTKGDDDVVEEEITVRRDGCYGHVYGQFNNNILMVGVEGSAPHAANKMTGEAHSRLGKIEELSSFVEPKMDKSKDINPAGNKFNITCIKVTPSNLSNLRRNAITNDNFKKEDFVNNILKATPKNGIHYDNDVKEKMKIYIERIKKYMDYENKKEKYKGVGIAATAVTFPTVFLGATGAKYAVKRIQEKVKNKNQDVPFHEKKYKRPPR